MQKPVASFIVPVFPLLAVALLAGGPVPSAWGQQFELFQPALERVNATVAYARRATGEGVRIAIDDIGVDILHPEFAGRIDYEEAGLTYTRYFLEQAVTTNCGDGRCVWSVAAGGDDAVIQQQAREIIERWGYPNREDRFFIFDTTAEENDAWEWHEIPPLYRPEGDYAHGTMVASVAAGAFFGIAPEATIVPAATDFVSLSGIAENLSVIYGLVDVIDSAISDRDLSALEETDSLLAEALDDYHDAADIINHSAHHPAISTLYDLSHVNAAFRRFLPNTARAALQQDREEKTIEVWAAGNDGSGRPLGSASFPLREPALRGHWLAVAALADNGSIASYSNRCGALPSNWNAAQDGRHYCLAAPGTVNAVTPGLRSRGAVQGALGTSFAAPLVSGGIALVMDYFRGQLSNREAALRVINTANNSGRYSDSRVYGAGLLDLDAATNPIGTVSTGTATVRAGLHRTRLATPPAWGRVGRHLAGREVAGFDAENAPFWQPAASLFATSPALDTVLPVPGWDEGFEQRALLSHLRWFGADGEGREDRGLRMTLWGDGFHAAGFRADFSGNGFAAETDYHAFGFSGEVMERLRLGVIVETQTNQGARPAGAFGAAANSKLVWLAREHAWPLSPAGEVALRLDYLLAAGQPDYARGAMFNATGSLYSAASLALEHRGSETRTRLSIGQPLRAESGRGTLRYAVGRDRAGNWRYEQLRFALRPETREVRFQLRHDRPLFKGQLAIELSYAHNADHIPGQHRAQAGLGYRRAW